MSPSLIKIKNIIQKEKLPDLSIYNDISEYILKANDTMIELESDNEENNKIEIQSTASGMKGTKVASSVKLFVFIL